MTSPRTRIAVAVATLVCASSRNAMAAHSCDGVRLELAEDLSPAWREAGRLLRTELVGSDAPCVSAVLVVTPAVGGARLSATTPDGRHTERLLTRPASLSPTALGIVASLPTETTEVAAQAPEIKFVPSEIDSSDASEAGPAALPRDPTPQVWVGASTGARIAEPTLLAMMDIDAQLGIESNHWLAVASFRYGTSFGESAVSADDAYYELVGALGVGRRFEIGASSLDVVLSPALSSASLDDDDDQDGPGHHARYMARVGASFCWWTAFRDGSRVSLTADTDITPYGLFQAVRIDPYGPPMPVWTAGIRLGAAGRIL